MTKEKDNFIWFIIGAVIFLVCLALSMVMNYLIMFHGEGDNHTFGIIQIALLSVVLGLSIAAVMHLSLYMLARMRRAEAMKKSVREALDK